MPGVLDEIRDENVERMKGKRFGIYRGIVRDVNDPESKGRVRVEIHEVLGPGKLTDWASYCSPFGGGGAGFFMLPRLGDGVWVMFERGEPTKPVWIGFWYSNEDKPPEDADKDVRVLQTKNGHKVVFKDVEGSESILIEDASGQKVEWECASGEIKVEANTKVIVKASEVEIGAGTSLSGIETEITHPVCYVTGQPIGVSKTVKGES
ncbi:MAG: hypothetical protein JRI22_09085 [Deltaproteobacteria bacterium]|nr:hypothetical protein [Deltaproteobacteria bacterium]